MIRALRLVTVVLALAAVAPAAEPILKLTGREKTLTFTAAEFAALPHTELKALEPHEKKERTYSGVGMRELLRMVGMPAGESFRGPALQLGVLVRSKDGYTVLFSLAEFDENFSSRTLLLADREDGLSPPTTAAPLRLVAPGDKRGARWSRMVASIEIVSVGEIAPRPAKP
jgi:hypothetical protein